MRIAFYGSSLLSAYWNGAATYYRGILRALAGRGHAITFYEPDVHDRQAHRDIDPPDWCRVTVYEGSVAALKAVAAQAAEADIVVKTSGVGFEDDRLLEEVMAAARPGALKVFWDVDAPATLAQMRAAPDHALRRMLPSLDLVLTYGGGDPVVSAYRALGAPDCVPIYNALDPHTHHPVAPEGRFNGDLAFLGNRLPDREARVGEFFLAPARAQPRRRFLLGGSGWAEPGLPDNVRLLGHVPTADHNALNATARMVLNISRDDMAATGFSPATRVFEAAGAGACLITDAWEGIELFLKPDEEILVAPRRTGRGRVRGDAERRAGRAHRRAGAGAGAERAHLPSPRRTGRPPVPGARAGTGRTMSAALDIVVLGLSLSSSWGNGHATTYRALLRGLAAEGHDVLFLERDVPWYAAHRDLPEPGFCNFALYDEIHAMLDRHGGRLRDADAVIVGSYLPEGVRLIDELAALAPRRFCFYDIDTPVTLGLLDAGGAEYLAARQVGLFDLHLSFAGGEVLDHLERVRGARRAEALHCAVDAERYAPAPGTPHRWDLGYLGTHSEDRQPGLEALLLEPARRLPDMRFVVAGPNYPDGIDWPANVERIDHLAPGDHPAFYNAQRYTLNVTRTAMREMGWSPSVRLFEAAACGTPIISDDWPGLTDLLPDGKAILVVRDTAGVVAALTGLDEARRRAIGEAARRRVLAGHTGRARARELATALRQVAPREAPARATRAPILAGRP